MNCEFFTERRARCHGVYGPNRGEECVHEDLTEKRCLSAQLCPRQALEYYGANIISSNDGFDNSSSGDGATFAGTNSMPRYGDSETTGYQKGLCASWAESFVYADKELEHGEEVARHHREARKIVSNNKKMQKECRQIAWTLADCLRTTRN